MEKDVAFALLMVALKHSLGKPKKHEIRYDVELPTPAVILREEF